MDDDLADNVLVPETAAAPSVGIADAASHGLMRGVDVEVIANAGSQSVKRATRYVGRRGPRRFHFYYTAMSFVFCPCCRWMNLNR